LKSEENFTLVSLAWHEAPGAKVSDPWSVFWSIFGLLFSWRVRWVQASLATQRRKFSSGH